MGTEILFRVLILLLVGFSVRHVLKYLLGVDNRAGGGVHRLLVRGRCLEKLALHARTPAAAKRWTPAPALDRKGAANASRNGHSA